MAQLGVKMGNVQLSSNGFADQLGLVLQHADFDFDMDDDCLIDLDVPSNRFLTLNKQKWLLEASGKTKLRTFLVVYDAIIQCLLWQVYYHTAIKA